MDVDILDELVIAVRRFVDEQLIPQEEAVAREDAIPATIVTAMRDLGLFGLSVPEAFGGIGLGTREEVEVMFQLGRASPAFRSLIATNVGIGSQGIVIDGTDEQKARFLPRVASGEAIASFALTEPGVGSDAGAVRTSARRDGDHYVLNGTKRFITNAPEAALFTVMARTDPESTDARGVSAFVVEANTPGLSIGKPEHKMGQHGTHVADVIFEDCRVPAENLIGKREGQGFKTAMRVLDKGRLGIAAACVGFAERILDETIAYANERVQFGQPLSAFQLTQVSVGDSKAEILAAKALVRDAARRRDAGEDVGIDASSAKLFASEMVGRVADRNVQIHGGSGYIADYPAERHYRDVRLYRIYEGTSEIQRLKIGRDMLRAGKGKG